MKSRQDFSHLLQGSHFLQNRQRAEASVLTNQMTSSYRRAIGADEGSDRDPDQDTSTETREPEKREQSEADKTVDQMRRTYNKSLGLPEDDGVENRESDDSADWYPDAK
jgi:hypothetical protein